MHTIQDHPVDTTYVRPLRNQLLLTSKRELVLLAPSAHGIPRCFSRVRHSSERYHQILSSAQKTRGSAYLQDGALWKSQLTNGRHRHPLDPGSWHVLLLDGRGTVCGCARYREYPNQTQFSQLSVALSALAQCSNWGESLSSSVSAELALSQRVSLPYVELGGWALHESIRGTTEAIRMALSTYALAQLLGGGVGITTATRRYGSASILRRIGGLPLEHDKSELPSYYDPQYGCEMEVLRFYSWAPNPKYAAWVAEMKAILRDALVVTPSATDSNRSVHSFEA